jgi:hypothetical protein
VHPWKSARFVLAFVSLFLMLRPAGVTAISILFFAAAIYLWTIGVVMLLAPGAISLMSGAPLMYGPELAAPYRALLVRLWLGAGRVGTVPPAQLGALGRNAGDDSGNRVAGTEDFGGGNWLAAAVVRTADRGPFRGGVVS